MPIPGDTETETNTCAYPGDMSLCIAKDSAVQEEAIKFVKWMTSKETVTKYAEAEGNPSCINGINYVAPQFSDLYHNYVTTGSFILNPDCNWTSAYVVSQRFRTVFRSVIFFLQKNIIEGLTAGAIKS